MINQINLSNIPIKIEYSDDKIGSANLGNLNYYKSKMKIQKSESTKMMQTIILHEAAHFALNHNGLDELSKEEKLIAIISNFALDLIMNNRDFIQWIWDDKNRLPLTKDQTKTIEELKDSYFVENIGKAIGDI